MTNHAKTMTAGFKMTFLKKKEEEKIVDAVLLYKVEKCRMLMFIKITSFHLQKQNDKIHTASNNNKSNSNSKER